MIGWCDDDQGVVFERIGVQVGGYPGIAHHREIDLPANEALQHHAAIADIEFDVDPRIQVVKLVQKRGTTKAPAVVSAAIFRLPI